MIEIRKTEIYDRWFSALKDRRAVAHINARLRRMALGNPGDVKHVGEGVSELCLDFGPGYRIYYTQHSRKVVILLAGGDKSTQKRDIEKAIELARML